MSNNQPSPGPFKSTTKKTVTISAITFNVVTEIDSTHVPPADCGCGGGSGALETLLTYLQQYASQLGSAPSPTGAPEPFPQGVPNS